MPRSLAVILGPALLPVSVADTLDGLLRVDGFGVVGRTPTVDVGSGNDTAFAFPNLLYAIAFATSNELIVEIIDFNF